MGRRYIAQVADTALSTNLTSIHFINDISYEIINLLQQAESQFYTQIHMYYEWEAKEVPRGVRISKVRRQDKFRKDWSQHKNTCKSQSGTGQGVRRSKRPLLACRTRCICSMETLHN